MTSADVANEPFAIFDGHNDTLLNLPLTGRSFFERSTEGHVDLPRAREGGLVGGLFAVFIPDPDSELLPSTEPAESDTPEEGERADHDIGLAAARATARYADQAAMPPPMALEYAQREALRAVAHLFRLERESAGAAKVALSVAEIRACLDAGALSMVLHFEGAEAIDPDLDALAVYHAAGLRSLGITWSRPNRFAHGVPFLFPSSPDTGPGLSDLGQALVRACNELRILIDLSHLNEAGFWDVAAISNAPLVATHSNVHAISPSARNLTARQLAAIRDSDGLVGVNFHVGFLDPAGERDADLPLSVLVDHVDALLEVLGPDRVAFGSDFDGATMPAAITDAAGLPNLIAALRQRGYDDALLRKLAFENWMRVLERTWGG